ncbi:hypothetical protein LK09_19140 [Microbacterium mangrovi]|uniref:DUF1684 domain-containing protein n=1 Tax=Microbacterium mangrovi TaxID=1348253 RepID=A0A0B1ZXL7_9MICO|nr:DUF1684 domain-containing protein [Microbacterium mangrovi]KHK95494.1 hypothetical protein LK09_19140 [Microbacterium mangrovi]
MTTYDAWTVARDRAVWGGFGIATLAGTNWLDGTPRSFDEVPGLWSTDGQSAIGELDGERIVLAPFADREVVRPDGVPVRLRGYARDGLVAVRVYVRSAPEEKGISRIDRFAYDPGFDVPGRFVAASDPGLRDAEAIDGHVSQKRYGGRVEFALPEGPAALTVEQDADGTLFAVFADATSGTESHRFRFLDLPAPAADGAVEVDLNRAYLPPCAFSDHYLCPLPPAENRLPAPVRAGEALVR